MWVDDKENVRGIKPVEKHGYTLVMNGGTSTDTEAFLHIRIPGEN